MVRTICNTSALRPECFQQVVDSLRTCRGISEYVFLPQIEPMRADEMRSIIDSIDFCEVRATYNPVQNRPGRNTQQALDACFALGADFAILCEEDIVLAPDALEYYEWAAGQYRDDPGVFSVTAYNRRKEPVLADQHHHIKRRRWFHPWGFATWRSRWDKIKEPLPNHWDEHLHETFVRQGVMAEVYPELARCNNIGRYSSIHKDPKLTPEWYDEHHHSKVWAVDGVEPGDWCEVG